MVHVFMCRHVYVYEYDCLMYVHMCTYCIRIILYDYATVVSSPPDTWQGVSFPS